MLLEAGSPATAPFVRDVGGWRSSGIRVTQCFTAKANKNPVNVEVGTAPGLSASSGMARASLLVVNVGGDGGSIFDGDDGGGGDGGGDDGGGGGVMLMLLLLLLLLLRLLLVFDFSSF